MISSVATNGTAFSAYALTQSTASATSATADASSTETQAPSNLTTPAAAGLGDLTAADWKLVSAAVGKNNGPDAQGQIPGGQPLLAWAIEMDRQSGKLSSGQELTVGDLKAMGANQPAAGYVDQINNAIAYLDQNLQTSLGSSSGRAVNIAA
jgi:hypothetical protein